MNTLKHLSIILVALAFWACSKKGPAGIDGNANVTEYNFEADFTLSGTSIYQAFTLPVSQAEADQSIFLCYYRITLYNPNWFICPDIGPGYNFITRGLISPGTSSTTYYLQVHDVDGSAYSGSEIRFDRVRIFVVPASAVVNLRLSQPIELMPYEAVCSLLGVQP